MVGSYKNELQIHPEETGVYNHLHRGSKIRQDYETQNNFQGDQEKINPKEHNWKWVNGELLQYLNYGVKMIGDHGRSKSFLSIKLLEREDWQLISAATSYISIKDGRAHGKRESSDNRIYSRLLGTRTFPLTSDDTIEIDAVIALDNIVKHDFGVPIVSLDDLTVNVDYGQAVERVEKFLKTFK